MRWERAICVLSERKSYEQHELDLYQTTRQTNVVDTN